MNPLLRDVLPALGLDEPFAAAHLDLLPGNALPSSLPVSTLACGSVAAAGLAGLALTGGQRVHVHPRQVSVAFRNDQLQTVDGATSPGFAPLSGFFRAADGWVRTHANYPHHRGRLAASLGLGEEPGRDELAAVVAGMPAQQVEDRVTADGGIAARVRDGAQWRAGAQAAAVDTHPLLAVEHTGRGGSRQDEGRAPRVLDLTRVIAGPVATRTLAHLGCDVLRLDPPWLPELPAQHIDTGAGKRSALVDVGSPEGRQRLEDLLSGADVLVTGYRPGALDRHGLDEASLAQRHPSLVVASLSAWTPSGPWGGRRGFDSIVQAATGIAVAESADGDRPGALPAQALDHATGYLLAAGVCAALRHRRHHGGTWRVRAHLARTAHWLLGAAGADPPPQPLEDTGRFMVATDTAYGRVVQSRPAFRVDHTQDGFAWVGRRWGSDDPGWSAAGPSRSTS